MSINGQCTVNCRTFNSKVTRSVYLGKHCPGRILSLQQITRLRIYALYNYSLIPCCACTYGQLDRSISGGQSTNREKAACSCSSDSDIAGKVRTALYG